MFLNPTNRSMKCEGGSWYPVTLLRLKHGKNVWVWVPSGSCQSPTFTTLAINSDMTKIEDTRVATFIGYTATIVSARVARRFNPKMKIAENKWPMKCKPKSNKSKSIHQQL